MDFVKNIVIRTIKSKSTYMLLATAVFEVVALILYVNFGTSVFIPELSPTAITFTVLGIAAPIIVAFVPFKICYVALYAIHLLSCLFYLASQASFIANVFVAIDGNTFPFAFYAIVALTLGSAVLSLVAMKFVKESGENEESSDRSIDKESELA